MPREEGEVVIYIIDNGYTDECSHKLIAFVKTHVDTGSMELFAKARGAIILGTIADADSPWWDVDPSIPMEKWISPIQIFYPQIKFYPGVIEEMPYEFWERWANDKDVMHKNLVEPFLDAVRAVLYKKEHGQ